jgi:hypothetical protein
VYVFLMLQTILLTSNTLSLISNSTDLIQAPGHRYLAISLEKSILTSDVPFIVKLLCTSQMFTLQKATWNAVHFPLLEMGTTVLSYPTISNCYQFLWQEVYKGNVITKENELQHFVWRSE